MTELISVLDKNKIEYKTGEPMRNHTTFRIGGPADILITVRSADELSTVVKTCRELGVDWMILGKGSNLLVSDDGIAGAVIALDGDFKSFEVSGNTVTCGAALSLSKLCTVAAENSLSGLEFAYGIPGSVGGAVFMNAGAYGGETKDAVTRVDYLTPEGDLGSYTAGELDFSYRHSVFKDNGYIILSAEYTLKPDDKEAILARMDDYMDRRRTKQPLEYPSAGSTFKRPEGAYAGALIQQCGLKGTSVGGAQVSEKHSGFIINTGSATCGDVMELIRLVQDTVKRETGYILECEVIRIGR